MKRPSRYLTITSYQQSRRMIRRAGQASSRCIHDGPTVWVAAVAAAGVQVKKDVGKLCPHRLAPAGSWLLASCSVPDCQCRRATKGKEGNSARPPAQRCACVPARLPRPTRVPAFPFYSSSRQAAAARRPRGPGLLPSQTTNTHVGDWESGDEAYCSLYC